jgi:hypothetical protein
MSEEKKTYKQVKLEFAVDSESPVLFVNTVNVRVGLEEFFFTVGSAIPPEVKNIKELERIETIEARPYFRFVVTRTVMRQMIDAMEKAYQDQSLQVDALRQQEERERGNS